MKCSGLVVHAQTFKGGEGKTKTFTKLFVPIGYEVVSVIAEGDYSHLSGVDDVPFRLGFKDNQLKLYFDGKED